MKYTFDDIAGYEQEKAELKKLCEIIANRKAYEKKGASLPKGIIFYGDTGTGKTLFAKVLASVCDLKILSIDLGGLSDERAIARRIRKVFAEAEKSAKPAMIFFDELDKVLPNEREEYVTDRAKSILAQLLTLIDGMESGNNFIFVATCNGYNSLPQTLVRPGRIDKKIHIAEPDYPSRVAILEMYARRTSCSFEMSMEELARLCPDFSCAALETLINECILQSDADGFISEKLIKERILESRSQDIPRPSSSQADYIQACRNIGSFVVAKNFNDGEYLLRLGDNTVCNLYFNGVISDFDDDFDDEDGIDFGEEFTADEGGAAIGFRDSDEDDGFDDDEDDQPYMYYTKTEYLQALCALMGGYAAEEVVLNKIYDNVQFPLTTADMVLTGISRAGLLGLNLRYNDARHDELRYSDERIQRINDEFDRILDDCLKKARLIVEANAALIRKLIPVLVDKRSIFRGECEKIISELGGITKLSLGEAAPN